MLQFGIWQVAVDNFLPKLFTVDYLNCVVTLKLRKEYLNSVTHTTPVLLRIKY